MTGPRRSLWALLGVLCVVALVHARALSGELVYDDLQMIARNPGLRDLANVPDFFRESYWDFLQTPGVATTAYWRPLTATALAVAYALGGGTTVGFHVASLLAHLGATAAAWAVALRLSRSAFVAGGAALLFGLHPLQVESVAWITALNDPLFAMLGLASVAAFLGWRDRGSRGVPILATLLLALALCAKELAVAIVPILVVADLLRPLRRDELGKPWKVLREVVAPARAYAGFALVLIGYYAARVAVFGEPTAGLERVTTFYGVPWQRLLLLRLELFGGGLALLALPLDLNLFRPFRPALPWTDPGVIAAAAACAVWAALLAFAWRGKRRAEIAALLIAPIAMLPMLVRVESVGRFPLSDRFLYVPVLGFALYVAACAHRALAPRKAALLLGALAALFGARAWTRIAAWHDEEALFRSALASDPRSPYAHWSLGRVLLERYQETGDVAYLSEAHAIYEEAKDLLEEALADRAGTDLFVSGADVLQVELGYGWCLLFEAQIDEFHDYDTPAAIFEALLERIHSIRNDVRQARERGIRVQVEPLEVEQVHVALGVARMLAGRLDEAEASFRAALVENEALPEAHHNLGRLMLLRDDPDRARSHFQRALELRPDDRKDKIALAQALVSGGWHDRAETIARELVERDAGDVEALMVLATAAQARGDWTGSLRWLDRVDAADPRHGFAAYRRARALVELEQPAPALSAFRRAAELAPDAFEIRYDFGAYLLSRGAQETAIPHLIAAYGLARDPNRYLALRETLSGLALEPADLVRLGVSDRSRHQSDAARAWLERAAELDPASGEIRLHLGRARRDTGDLAGAAESLAAAAERLPEEFVPRFELGATLRELGRPAEALEALRAARAIGPPETWSPGEAAAVSRKLEELIHELEYAGPLGGPPAGG